MAEKVLKSQNAEAIGNKRDQEGRAGGYADMTICARPSLIPKLPGNEAMPDQNFQQLPMPDLNFQQLPTTKMHATCLCLPNNVLHSLVPCIYTTGNLTHPHIAYVVDQAEKPCRKPYVLPPHLISSPSMSLHSLPCQSLSPVRNRLILIHFVQQRQSS